MESGRGGLASERNVVNWDASATARDLADTLTSWCDEHWLNPAWQVRANAAARHLLERTDLLRRHAHVDKLFDEVTDAIRRARAAADRPRNRTTFPVGPCPERDQEGAWCTGDIIAFIPTEDARPARMECRANPEHRWTSVQWLRAGKRILDRIQQKKRGAA
jgi:hypothetical protein